MKKKSLFSLLFSSWIFGIFLICLFPPVPDFDVSDQTYSQLSQDAFPEIHQRITSSSALLDWGSGLDLLGHSVDFFNDHQFGIFSTADLVNPSIQISSLFDTWILFEAFFETW